MILVGTAMGGDARVISFLHASRVLFVVLALPFAFQFFLGYEPGKRPAPGVPMTELGLIDLGVLALCAVVGATLARLIRLPAWQLVGPMLLSAAVHLAGWTNASLPTELIQLSQLVIGTAIGCRFAGTPLRFIARAMVWAAMLTVILVGVTLVCAAAVHYATGLPTPHLVLAYAPGGLAEMSLVALALAFDPSFVATHHIVRIFLVVVLAPLVFRLLQRVRNT
jgi:membrane AbrB-like protein